MSISKRKHIGLLVLPFVFAAILQADQETDRIPELEKKLVTTQDRERVDTLNDLAFSYVEKRDLKKAGLYVEQAQALAEKLKYLKGKGAAHFVAARIFWVQDKWDEAIKLCRQAKEEADRGGDQLGWVRAATLSARAKGEQSNYKDKLKELLEALDRAQNIERSEKELILIHLHLSFVYQTFKNLAEAEEHMATGLDLATRINDHYWQGILLIQRGNLHGTQNKTNEALADFQLALTHFSAIHDEDSMMAVKCNIADILAEMGQEAQALKYYLAAVEHFRRTKKNIDLLPALMQLGGLYVKLKQYQQADACYKEGVTLAESMPYIYYKMGVCKIYADFCYTRGRFQEAYDYFRKYSELSTEVHSQENEKQIVELNAKYEMETRKREIALLQKDKKIEQLKRYGLIAMLLLLVSGAGLLFRKYLYLLAFWKKQKYIGQYRIGETLGAGGMGVVYKAHTLKDKNTTVAIKVLKDELLESDTYKRRFKREGMIIDRLNHPHIIKVFERGEAEGKLFIVMEYVPGQSLAQLISGQGALALETGLHIMRQICGALQEIHGQNIVHRDLKPSNILVSDWQGDPFYIKLLDFGLSKVSHHSRVTVTGEMVGTLAYLAPEQITQQVSTPASDIFALGLIFFELLTGKLLYQGEKISALIDKILYYAPEPLQTVNPALPSVLNDLVLAMQAKDPAQRPALVTIIKILDSVTATSVLQR